MSMRLSVITSRCKPPDHAFLKIRFNEIFYQSTLLVGKHSNNKKKIVSNNKIRKYDFQNVPSTFMNDQDWEAKINQIKVGFNEAQSVEVMCNHIQQILNDEMKQKVFPLYNLGKNKPY